MKLNQMGKTVRRAAVAATAIGLFFDPGFALAQDYAGMSCAQLWHARNAIFAANGYCFKTAQARSVFGPGCFPPYGRMSSYEQQQVNQIRYWERVKGCG